MSAITDDIKNYLRLIVTMRSDGRHVRPADWKYCGPEDLVLQHGVTFTGVRAVRLGAPKMCYTNAFELLLRDSSLLYCEGWACASVDFPVQHAWCCDGDGVIVDPTWSNPDHQRYLGCVFEREVLFEEVVRKGSYGLFPGHNEAYNRHVIHGHVATAEVSWSELVAA